MVLRTSDPINVSNPSGTPQVRQSGVGPVAPDVRKFSRGGALPSESTADRILSSLIPLGMKAAEGAFKEQLESKYLEGVQAAAQGRSEEELETNPLTADWTKAGYRDTAGRLAISQQQAQLQLDLPKLAQGTPEDFRTYMDTKRPALVDQLNGMSKQQRAAAFAQMANDEIGAQKKYTTARSAWILEQEQRSIQQSMTVRRGNMDAAKGDMELYQTEVSNFTGAIYKDVWQNPKLTPQLKQDMTRQAAEFASSSDNVAVYDQLKNVQFDFADGTRGTMMSRLSFEDQIKVDKAHRSSMDRVKVTRSQDFETWKAASMTAWSDPNVGATESFDEVDAQIRAAESSGILGVGGRETILKSYFTAKARNNDDSYSAQAYARGDQQALFSRGKDAQDGLKAYLKVNKGQPLPQVVQGLMTIGNNYGQDTALVQAGEFLKPAFATLGYGEEISPQNAELVTNTLQALSIADQNNPGAKSKFIQTLEPAQQDMALYIAEAQKEGIADPMTAIKYARSKQLQDKQTGGLRQEMVAKARKEDAAVVQDIDDRQLLGTISAPFKAFFSTDGANRDKLRTGRSWFENADRTADIRAQGQVALAEELAIIGQTNPTMSADSRRSKALANVAGRAVETESGPLIMPRGQSLQSYFGVPAYADQQFVGKSIDDMMKPQEGNRIAWSIDATNKLIYRELNGENKVVKSGVMDPKTVAPAVQARLDSEAEKQSQQVGPGVETNGVRYNGLNTANIEPNQMLKLRADIVQSEGVRNSKYPDGKVGESSFGVGIHQSNNHYQQPLNRDGTYTDSQIRDTFNRASNDAAEMAVKSMKSIGVQGEGYLRFFGELAYQSPKSARDPDLLAHISLGNKAEALAALKATPAYKNSPSDRQERYVQKLQAAMR
ncbi:internal virion protein [Pseudomonas phage Misse]|uniref:Internal virion protein n=1 Tax=Pseudomonas phage Bertil TaxID=2801385 RepID=A0A7T8EQF9_9CAUD|nr:internal virion protein [Pseudomonas phage Bertil]QQO90857.1 internal virion protein [Pseudomonas phage Misse]QQO90908.1 internal virion protein [Pseudomonas phage Strit]